MGKSRQSQDFTFDLRSGSSHQRRKAARWIRTEKDRAHEKVLLEAIRTEIHSPKTWETQYQMIMALGEIKAKSATEFLWALPEKELEYMPLLAAGDAVMNICSNADTFGRALGTECVPFIAGVLRAVAQPGFDLALTPLAVECAAARREPDILYWGLAAGQKDANIDASRLVRLAKASSESYLAKAADHYAAGIALDVSRL